MDNVEPIEKEVVNKFAKKDKRKTKKMKVSGKNVFDLKKTIEKKARKQD